MVYFNPIGNKPVQPIGSSGSNAGGAKPVNVPKSTGVDAFTPSFGAAASRSNPSVGNIVANVGKLSGAEARGQLSGSTASGLDSFSKIFEAL